MNDGGTISPAFLTEVANQLFDRTPISYFLSSPKQRVSGRPYEHDPEKGFTMDIMMMMDMEKARFYLYATHVSTSC
ncbi:hypothetical protein DVH05_020233 [Phytophthora capsici]|nr:hypothetical protein DVH05_020233 [Phytophthora capsici]